MSDGLMTEGAARELAYIRHRLDGVAEEQARQRAILEGLAGNGQPGRIGWLEKRMARQEERMNRVIGIGIAAGSAVTVLDVILRWFRF